MVAYVGSTSERRDETAWTTKAASANAFASGAEWASRWDDHYGSRTNTDDAVGLLAELAVGRPVLEFGVGTGRLALPLQARGLHVHGIDCSEWMLAELARKPGGDRLPVTLGDITTTRLGQDYGLVFVADYTLLALTTQDEQIRCFENAAWHLRPAGLFVIEVSSPLGAGLASDACRPIEVTPSSLTLFVSRPNPVTQELDQCYVYLRDGEPVRLRPVASRFAWPSELDLMARMCGLRLVERWGGWSREAFTKHSTAHVSVYEKPCR